MNVAKKLTSNAFILTIPILIWNILLTPKLPIAYQPINFNSHVPSFVFIGENLFRISIFILAIAIQFDINSKNGRLGLKVYLIGCALYFISWLVLIYAPNSWWSLSIFGFTAPAYTPIIWLLGISLMGHTYYFNFKFSYWHLLIPSLLFSIFHMTHSIIVYWTMSTYSDNLKIPPRDLFT
ncbi:hypothetical protein [Anditalea andensis]|uniref:Uncharacterized protein n=1 Tax=Anditalea andensis TaxID=1048983 RepID=A0A074L770_9BACT|nr:hypothetical protein [Anditalea andensis]KEO75678.1 hypothetical protein EL17_21845 [Anditalea andensis]